MSAEPFGFDGYKLSIGDAERRVMEAQDRLQDLMDDVREAQQAVEEACCDLRDARRASQESGDEAWASWWAAHNLPGAVS